MSTGQLRVNELFKRLGDDAARSTLSFMRTMPNTWDNCVARAAISFYLKPLF